MFKNMIRKAISMLTIVALILTSVLSVSFFVTAADTYKVALTNIDGRTEGDTLEGDNWLDYVVEIGNITPAEASEKDRNDYYEGCQAFICSAQRREQTMIFAFDAGDGFLLKNPVISWQGQALQDKKNTIKVYIGATPDADGDWELLNAIGADSELYETDSAYGTPMVSDVSALVGNGIKTIYVKVTMYLQSLGAEYRTAFSNLTVTADKVEGTEENATATGFLTPGLEESISLSKLGSVSFTVVTLPIQLTDRDCSVTVADTAVASLEVDINGVWTLTGLAEGTTKLTIRSLIDSDYYKEIPVSVSGSNYFFSDAYSVYSSDESGNINGGKGSFGNVSTNGYGPVSHVAGDYIVKRNVDFSAFGQIGASSVRAVFGWDASNTSLAVWEVYADSVAEDNLLTTINVEPYGESSETQQTVFAVFDRTLTGKHDIYFVQKTTGSRFYEVSYGNFEAKYSQDIKHYYFQTQSNEFMNNIVAVRGIKNVDGTTLMPKTSGVAGEVVYRVDAAAGKTLDDVDINVSSRNITSNGLSYGTVSVMISYDQLVWHTLKTVTDKLENTTTQGTNPDTTTINADDLECSGYVDGQKTVYIKFSLIRTPKAQETWNHIARIDIDVTDTDNQTAVQEATDIAVSTVPAIEWSTAKSGNLTLTEGDNIILKAEALPITVVDKTLSVVSSDTNVIAVEDKGNGEYAVAAFQDGYAGITVSTPSGITKFINITVDPAPTYTHMTVSVNPNKNQNASIHDEGTMHPVNRVYTSWTGDEFGMGNTTTGDYALLKSVDFSAFGEEGPLFCYIRASNYQGETTNKRWIAYVDSMEQENIFTEFTVQPINGWDYQQIIISEVGKTLTGVHDIYLVCEEGGSLWSITFTDDPTMGDKSYELPFATNFESSDTVWLEHIVEDTMSGISFSGELTAASYGDNYNSDTPVESYDDMEVNGTMILRMDAPIGAVLEDAIMEYSGRSIASSQQDPYCMLPGKIEFYVSPDMESWTKVAELCDESGNPSFAVNIAEWTDGLETFYIRIDITRTSVFASWTRLTSLAVTSASGDINVDFVKITPEPEGLTLPFETDFTTNEWNSGVVAKSTQIGIQRSFDNNDMEVSCLQATSSKEYEGVIMKFLPAEGELIENLVVKLNGRAVGGAILGAYVSTDMENWTEASVTSNAAVSDDDYSGLKLYATSFEEPADRVYLKIIFYSTGETFIDYAALTALSVQANLVDKVEENVPYNTVFSIGRTQINSWLRKVTDMSGLHISQTSSTISMSPAAGKNGSITMLYNSGDKAFEDLFINMKGKATNGSEIVIAVSHDGKNFENIAYISEQSDEYASSTTYRHEYDISSVAKGHKNIWVKISLKAVGAAGNCALTSFGITYDKAYTVPVVMPDIWQDYVFDTSMFYEEDLINNSASGKLPQTSDSSNPTAVIFIGMLMLAVLVGCGIYLYKSQKNSSLTEKIKER